MHFNKPTCLHFWKTVYNCRIGGDRIWSQSQLPLRVFSASTEWLYTISLSPRSKCNSEASESQSCHGSWRFSVSNDSALNVPSQTSVCSSHSPCLCLGLLQALGAKPTLTTGLLALQILLQVKTFLSTQLLQISNKLSSLMNSVFFGNHKAI